ncbi:MAG: acyltransferase, partial [Pseudomonadota bacterium]
MSGGAYRPDIDGLRAVAVLPVVAFHLGAPFATGGFVGVDVFFVISGFLITRIVAQEIEEGRFSLVGFYERRARRIFPALFFLIAVVLAAAAILFMPNSLAEAARSAVAATLFASNVLFFLEAGYFEAAAFGKPLLHTWSLAVEEQFYIVAPLLLMALARFGGRAAVWLGGLTVLSFALSALTTASYPTAAYYLLPWRAWELGIGAMLALGVGPRLEDRTLREAAAALGLVLILAAV